MFLYIYRSDCLVVQLDDLSRQPWYVGDASRLTAESMVRSCGHDGAFVVRQSQKGGVSNPFTLTLVHAGNVYNLHLRRRSDTKFAIGKEKAEEIVSVIASNCDNVRTVPHFAHGSGSLRMGLLKIEKNGTQ